MVQQIQKYLFIVCLAFVAFACTEKKQTSKSLQADYNEAHRPQFHFSPMKNWMNDPNGMVFLDGEYHLFYQYYPEGMVWGPMHWGHAVSHDMIHWTHLPIALYPDSLGLIFSGSAVYDEHNTSGLGTANNPPLVAIFTYHSMQKEKAGRSDYQVQGIAYSVDRGRTWTKYEHNPVIKNPGEKNFRDPKVFWHEETNQWIMILAAGDHVELWGAQDLKNWRKLSEFGQGIGAHGGVWECPDLFKINVEGSNEEKWVMFVSINPGAPNGGTGTQYFVGSFDGEKFTCEKCSDVATSWIDYGADNYAGVTWSNISSKDGRRLFLGWMSNWDYANVVPTSPWRSAMTVPRSLKLEKVEGQYLVESLPVEELNSVFGKSKVYEGAVVADSLDLTTDILSASTYQLNLDLDDVDDGFVIELSNEDGQKVAIGFNAEEGNQFYIDRTKSSPTFSPTFLSKQFAPRFINDKKFKIRLLVDRSSIEMFADNGLTVMTDLVFPNHLFKRLVIKKINNPFKLTGASVTEVNSIW